MDFHFSQFEILTGTGALFLCLFFICVFSEASDIEDELGSAVAAAVSKQNLFWASVEAQGQGMRLSGAAPDHAAREQAGQIAAETWGVTRVTNDIKVIGEAGTCQQEFDEYLERESVSFKAGRADLTDSSYPLLDMLASIARACGARIEIAAHTDSRGDAAVNLKLSQRRADVVRKYLVQSGVAAEEVNAAGYGETQPIATNDTEAGRQSNRRVEFRVIGGRS